MTKQSTMLSVFLERLAFALLVALALTFAFEIPFGSSVAEATLTNVKILDAAVIGCWTLSRLASWRWPRVPRPLALPIVLWVVVLAISTLLAPAYLSHTV